MIRLLITINDENDFDIERFPEPAGHSPRSANLFRLIGKSKIKRESMGAILGEAQNMMNAIVEDIKKAKKIKPAPDAKEKKP